MSKKLLVVETDASYRDELVRQLSARGHEVLGVAHSLIALDALDQAGAKFDVLVTAIDLGPGRPHGIALGSMAKVRRRGIEVVFLTSSEDEVGPEDHVVGIPVDRASGVAAILAVIADGRKLSSPLAGADLTAGP